MSKVSFISANFVARELGWSMTEGWRQGDRATQAHYSPVETYEQRFDELVADVAALGFDAIDIWLAHLDPTWATDDHLVAARKVLENRAMAVPSIQGALGHDLERFRRSCEIAVALGAKVLGGRTALLESDRQALIDLLNEFDLALAFENHPETPDEVLAYVGDGADGRLGFAVDTGWFGTQGYDAAQAIRDLWPRVFQVHVKDVKAAGAHDTVALGAGVVPVQECVTELQRLGYQGAYAIEHEPHHYDPSQEIREGRALVEAWLASGGANE